MSNMLNHDVIIRCIAQPLFPRGMKNLYLHMPEQC